MDSDDNKSIPAGEMQQRIDSIIRELNLASDSVFDHYITQSPKMQNAVSSAQKELGITHSTIPPKYQNDWIERNNIVLKKWFETTTLPESWYTFFIHYVMTDYRMPSTDLVVKKRFVEVQETDDDTVTLKIHKGLRYEEYTGIWKALSPFLGNGRRKNKLPDYDTRIRDMQMYGKHKSGYTNKMIADDYIVALNDDNAKDTVKKAIRRQKKLYEKGTDLAE